MKKYFFLMGLVSVAAPQVHAADALIQIQDQWSVCQYQVEKDAKEGCLETLSKEANQQSLQNKSRVDLLIWSAIVKSSWAGAKGGLDALSLVKEAFDTNWIAPYGPQLDAFEKEMASYISVDKALAVTSGTAAIHLALRWYDVKQGDIKFCSDFTFIGSCTPILYQNATPVFIDSEPDSWNMSPIALE